MLMIIWIYGEPCSGKTTLAKTVASEVRGKLMDSHAAREQVGNWDLSEDGRDKHIDYMIYAAGLVAEYSNVVVCAVTPKIAQRERIKERLAAHGVSLVLATYKPEDLRRRQIERFGATMKPSCFEYEASR